MNERVITLEDMEELQSFLIGEPAKRLDLTVPKKDQPRLSIDKANSVIWYLQEVLCVLPSRFEYCHSCGTLFDSHSSGHLGKQDKTYCDNCD